MAYEIVKKFRETNDVATLARLSSRVNASDGRRGKLHNVFEPSFDWKECRSNMFKEQKLNYIHENPCRGVWSLVNDLCDYLHSSAKFYSTGEPGIYTVTNFMELDDLDLTKPFE